MITYSFMSIMISNINLTKLCYHTSYYGLCLTVIPNIGCTTVPGSPIIFIIITSMTIQRETGI